MSRSLKDKLIQLGPEILADMLIDISSDNELASHKVMRTVSAKSDNVKNFKSKLKYFVGSNRFVPWKYSSQFASEVSDLLRDIEQGAQSPQEGIELLFEFFKTDEHVFNMADDSSGHIGDVFRNDATELFAKYARQVDNKEDLLEELLNLVEDDGYGVRDALLDCAENYLNPDELKILYYKLVERSKKSTKERDSWSWKLSEIAKQMKDAPLYEELIRKRVGDRINSKFIVDISEVYFSAGDIESAQRHLDSIAKDDTYASVDREELQKKIYKVTKQSGPLIEQLTKEFKSHYSEHTLKELLSVVGEEKRESLCKEAIKDILEYKSWDPSSAEFLLYCEAIDEAEQYVLKSAGQLDGERYYSLAPLAEKFEANDRHLVAILIYRALTDSILERAISKYYHHGVNYMSSAKVLSAKVKDWRSFPTQEVYLAQIKETHGRKSSFWQRMGK
jgi:hypothetical protein